MPPQQSIYYARCPVPTASGIAFQRGMFDAAYAGTGTSVRNIRDLGPEYADAHFSHELDSFVREGGCTPAIWARARGAKTRLLGITFMPEPLGVYVRTDDAATTITELRGRRFALPDWPRLLFNFWRVAAHKGFVSALEAHDMHPSDVELVDVVEDQDPHRKLNLTMEQTGRMDSRSEYSGQLRALLDGAVDAIFAKGAESAIVEREAGGRIRKLYDLRQSPNVSHHVNNSTPRLLTCSEQLLTENPQAVATYMSTIADAARWAQDYPQDLQQFVARECGIEMADIGNLFPENYMNEFQPVLDAKYIELTGTMKQFMFNQGYIDNDFSLDEWICADAIG